MKKSEVTPGTLYAIKSRFVSDPVLVLDVSRTYRITVSGRGGETSVIESTENEVGRRSGLLCLRITDDTVDTAAMLDAVMSHVAATGTIPAQYDVRIEKPARLDQLWADYVIERDALRKKMNDNLRSRSLENPVIADITDRMATLGVPADVFAHGTTKAVLSLDDLLALVAAAENVAH